jgi:hypothetical protein
MGHGAFPLLKGENIFQLYFFMASKIEEISVKI